MGYTQGGRWSIPMARPAPIQVSFLGYPATMGADFIDYLIADRWIAPLDDQPFYTERLVQLPECYQPSDTRRVVGPAPSRATCGLPERGFVFCCFNNSYKITPAFLDIWTRLLRQIPDSVLWLVKSYPAVETNLRREAAARGIAPERLMFADRVPMAEYLARLAAADLFLDTLPYNAGATANDALWAGLPVLTCTGDGYSGRMAGSLLQAVGLPELVTGSLDEYEALALRLATEPEVLAGLRERLARNRDTAPLFDMARYTRHLEAAYRQMFETWQRGDPPSSFVIDPL
jgi:protein O-GlcNAc transferase